MGSSISCFSRVSIVIALTLFFRPIFIEGEVKADDETTGFQREEVGDNQPLPNIGGWYNFSPAPCLP